MSEKQYVAKLLFKYKMNPTQKDIQNLVDWLYDLVENIHNKLLKNFHKPIKIEEEYLSISKGNLFTI